MNYYDFQEEPSPGPPNRLAVVGDKIRYFGNDLAYTLCQRTDGQKVVSSYLNISDGTILLLSGPHRSKKVLKNGELFNLLNEKGVPTFQTLTLQQLREQFCEPFEILEVPT